MFEKDLNVFWLLCGNKLNPSSRIQGINIHLELVKLGYNTHLLHVPFFYSEDIIWNSYFSSLFINSLNPDDIVIFQKLNGPKTLDLIKEVKKVGAKSFFIDCDLPLKLKIANSVDKIICPSINLANYYINAGFNNVDVIFDAVEIFKKPEPLIKVSKKMIWFGKSGLGKWDHISKVKKLILPGIAPNWRIFTLSNHKNADFKWDIKSFDRIISNHDLSIIPIDKSEENLVKSSNRCTQSMALGVPVLSNFLDSYSGVIVNYQNGLMSDDLFEWKNFLEKCEDLNFLNALKQKAYEDSLKFSIENIIKVWIITLQLDKCIRSIYIRLKDFIVFSFLLRWIGCSRIFYDRKS